MGSAERYGLPIVVFDLDSTIANTHQRRHLTPTMSEPTDADWLAYAMACVDDEVFEGTAQLIRLLWPTHQIWILSGRSEEALDLTQEWFKKHEIPSDVFRLRNRHDVRDNAKYKVSFIQEALRAGFKIKLMVEDWPRVAKAIQEQTGVPVLITNPDYPEGDSAMTHHESTSVDNPA